MVSRREEEKEGVLALLWRPKVCCVCEMSRAYMLGAQLNWNSTGERE